MFVIRIYIYTTSSFKSLYFKRIKRTTMRLRINITINNNHKIDKKKKTKHTQNKRARKKKSKRWTKQKPEQIKSNGSILFDELDKFDCILRIRFAQMHRVLRLNGVSNNFIPIRCETKENPIQNWI